MQYAPLAITPDEFLSAFFEPAENVCIRIFPDKSGTAFSAHKFDCKAGKLHSQLPLLKEHNKSERGIFFVVNFGGHDAKSIKRINSHFVDLDKGTHEEQLERIQAFPLEPSLIVKTKHGFHAYWLMSQADISMFSHVQKQLVKQFDGDYACVDLPRVLRLPGFYHHKQEPFLINCIKFNPEIRYKQSQLAELLPAVPYEPDSSLNAKSDKNITNVGKQKGLMLIGKTCDFIPYCKKNANSLPEPLWYGMITVLSPLEGGREAIHSMSKSHPQYSPEQTDNKIEHFFKSKTKPMTCKKLSEHGFQCPNLGKCKSRSPAGLTFIPLDTKLLKKLLAKTKKTDNAVDNIQVAMRFISDFMYNFDPVIADVFISTEIKDHFGFKVGEIKALPTFQKEMHRAFTGSQAAREVAYEEGESRQIPPWYEVNERGTWRFLPRVLADELAEKEPIINVGEKYYFYEDGVYVPHSDKKAMCHISNHMSNRYSTANEIRDAEFQWNIKIDKSTRELNVNPYIMNFQNGLYNLLTDELMPHDPKILSTIRLGGNYNPAHSEDLDCRVFMEYLDFVLPKSEHKLIQEILGYSMIAINKSQKSFIFEGKEHSGKSTLLYIIQELLLGHQNVSNVPWQDLDEKFATVQLFGKLVNMFADLPAKNLQDTGIFKAITGEDYISAQHKFKEYFSFKPFCRLFWSANFIPKNYVDRSGGFYRRLLIINFSKRIPDDKKDSNLKEKLAMETDGIIAWAIDGLKRLMESNWQFSETDRTRAALANYKADNSNVLAFVEECCIVDSDAEVLRDELFKEYNEWCSTSTNKACGQRRFYSEIDDIAGVERSLASVTRHKTWKGIRLRKS